MTSSRISTLGLASAFLFFTFLLGARAASAATITVDALTNTGGAGCELREAILSANTDAAVGGCTSGASGLDAIVFSGSGTVDISNQDLPNITSIITMDGGSDIIVDSNTTSRRIFTLSGTTSTTFVLSNITLQRGRQTNGGCISMEGASGRSLTLSNVDFTWCTATGDGGAIYMPTGAGGSISMSDVTFTSSSASGAGGAVWTGSGVDVTGEQIVAFKNRAGVGGGAVYATSSSMTLTPGLLSIGSSTFTSNTSTAGSGGGAIFSSKTTSTIAASTFANNSATTTVFLGGGAILFSSDRPMYAFIASSTFRGNVANYEGGAIQFIVPNGIAGGFDVADSLFQENLSLYAGGIAIFGSTSTVSTLTRSLFLRNTATSDAGALEIQRANYVISNNTFEQNHATFAGGIYSAGGAIDVFSNTFYNNSVSGTYAGVVLAPFVAYGTTTYRYTNNIFEGNYNNNGLNSCSWLGATEMTSLGSNLFDTSSTSCPTVASDLFSSSARLGALQNNGGYTLSRLPADDSIVVNAANATYAPSVDQRNFARPQGAGYDIGATDIADVTAPILAQVAPITTPQSDLTPDFSFTSNQAGTISYPGTCSSVTVQATSGTNAITFNTLNSGTRYDNCQVRVTDGSGNATTLTLTAFDTTGSPGSSGGSSSGGGGLGSAGTVAIPPTETTFQTNLQNLQNQGVAVHGLIKIPSNSAVYYVGSDGKRHAFPNDKVYFTWYENFDGVQLVNEAQLSSIPLGKNVTYKPGKKMVKFTTDAKVYVVAKGGILRGIRTEAAATELYGASWNTQIDDISDAFYTNYTFGAEVSGLSDFNPTTVQASVQFPSDSLQM